MLLTCTVEDRPEGTPDSKRRSSYHRERDMVYRTNSTSQTNEDGSDEVADPHAEPGVPPCQAAPGNHGGSNHPGVDVERVSDPEAWTRWLAIGFLKTGTSSSPKVHTDEIPRSPLPSLRFDGLQIMVGEHELGIGQTRLRLGL